MHVCVRSSGFARVYACDSVCVSVDVAVGRLYVCLWCDCAHIITVAASGIQINNNQMVSVRTVGAIVCVSSYAHRIHQIGDGIYCNHFNLTHVSVCAFDSFVCL